MTRPVRTPVRKKPASPITPNAAMIIIAVALCGLWMIEAYDLAVDAQLYQYGILSREPRGLSGILVAPFIHVSAAHLFGNSVPFAVFGWIALTRNGIRFVIVTVVSLLVSGLGVWAVGPPNTLTVGASGVVFGWLGYILSRGLADRRQLITGWPLLVMVGGLVWGLLPITPGTSWQGHLFGLAGGALTGLLVTRWRPARRPAPAAAPKRPSGGPMGPAPGGVVASSPPVYKPPPAYRPGQHPDGPPYAERR